MKSKFDEKHSAMLKVIDPEIAAFYTDWLYLRESNDFEATANLLAHLAREMLEGLQEIGVKKKKVPEGTRKIWKRTIKHFEKFRHNREVWKAPREERGV